MSNESIGQHAAKEFRDELKLGYNPIDNMARLIERKVGVGVAYVNTPTPGHGMSMRLGERYLIAVGCTEHPMRLRSTLAHELGHLRLGSVDRVLGHNEWDKRTPEEIHADAFARHLLIPLSAVSATADGVTPTTSLLSDLVQSYKASPSMVAIQMRTSGLIGQDTCDEWSRLSTAKLASQFGWHKEYEALAGETRSARAPQPLLARAIEGYRWGLVAAAAIARLDGKSNPDDVRDQLEADGVTPIELDDLVPERPEKVGQSLTPQEIAFLMDGTS